MMNNVPDISVLVPAFQAKNFISQAIVSALNQSGVSVEVIVIDDCSSDGTARAVEDLFATDTRVRVVTLSQNGGPARARNIGIQHAKADWIAVLDADDAFDEGRLHRLLCKAKELDADVIADNIRYYDAQIKTLSGPQLTDIGRFLQLTQHSFVDRARPGAIGMDLGLLKPMYKKAFLDTKKVIYPEDIRHGEDFTFYFQLLQERARFFVIPEPGYRWTLRNSGNSQTREDYIGQRNEALRLANTVGYDKDLANLLKVRGSSLMRLHYMKRIRSAWVEHDALEMIKLGIMHPIESISYYIKAARRKLYRRVV